MTITITHDQAFLHDCDNTTLGGTNPGWLETRGNMLDPDTTFSTNGDVFTLTGTTDDVGLVEWMGVDYVFTSSINTATYTKCLVRWKTSAASAGLQAEIAFIDAGGEHQRVVLGYSTSWTTTEITLTSETMIAVKLYACENAAANANGTYSVYYDFVMIYADKFTLPTFPKGLHLHIEPQDVDMGIPGRIGEIQQGLGLKSPTLVISGTTDTATSWHGDYAIDLEYLYRIMFQTSTSMWQWLTAEITSTFKIAWKVRPKPLDIEADSTPDDMLKWTWELKKVDTISGSNWTWYEYFGVT